MPHFFFDENLEKKRLEHFPTYVLEALIAYKKEKRIRESHISVHALKKLSTREDRQDPNLLLMYFYKNEIKNSRFHITQTHPSKYEFFPPTHVPVNKKYTELGLPVFINVLCYALGIGGIKFSNHKEGYYRLLAEYPPPLKTFKNCADEIGKIFKNKGKVSKVELHSLAIIYAPGLEKELLQINKEIARFNRFPSSRP